MLNALDNYKRRKKMTFNLEKTKKHINMTREIMGKQIEEGIAKDLYGVDERLISWAYANIPTKELKKIIKQEEEEMERTR